MTGEQSSGPQRFGVLLVTLLVLLVGSGLLDYVGRYLNRRALIGLAFLLLVQVLIVAVVSVPTRRHGSGVTIRLLVAGTIGMQLLAAVVAGDSIRVAAQFVALLCVGYAIFVVLNFLARARQADRGTIHAAICVFLLMGVFWAMLYAAIARLEPGAFTTSSGAAPAMGVGAGSATALYFSMVTLTTLGYGDITPVTTAARMAAALQALAGQVYLVVLVARLVGLSVAPRSPRDRD